MHGDLRKGEQQLILHQIGQIHPVSNDRQRLIGLRDIPLSVAARQHEVHLRIDLVYHHPEAALALQG
jgi:hypothetical protein